MLTLLHPVLEGSPDFGPDDELGETAYYGPYEPDHATITKFRGERPSVLVFHVPFAMRGARAEKGMRALLNKEWTSDDVCAAAGPAAAVTYYCQQLVEYADWVRYGRERGWESSFHQTPYKAAGTILSYAPDETVPDRPMEVLTRSRDLLHRLDASDLDEDLDFATGFAAALAIVAIGGVDGMAIRRALWDA